MRTDTRRPMHSRRSYGDRGRAPTAPMYWGWSHANERMEMMDLASYLDAYRVGYQQASDDMQARWQQYADALLGGAVPPGPTGLRTGHHRHQHEHHHGCEHCEAGHGWERHEHHGDCCHECHDDCSCECCISNDADVVVYARCGEVRVVPIEIENDTRRARPDVTVEVSDVRTAGGRVLPWAVRLDTEGPLTLEPCSRTTIELAVQVSCGERTVEKPAPAEPVRGAKGKASAEQETTGAVSVDRTATDVDRCEVGYLSVRVEGCLLRPIVIAVAARPKHCDAFVMGCSCSCCC